MGEFFGFISYSRSLSTDRLKQCELVALEERMRVGDVRLAALVNTDETMQIQLSLKRLINRRHEVLRKYFGYKPLFVQNKNSLVALTPCYDLTEGGRRHHFVQLAHEFKDFRLGLVFILGSLGHKCLPVENFNL